MAKITLPEFKLPKFDLEALLGLQKSNLAVVHETQTVLVDAFQAIARLQYGYAQELAANAKAALSAKQPSEPRPPWPMFRPPPARRSR
jgi:hypothetical protein